MSMGPYLATSVVIGLGEWGRAVAEGVGAALQDRSPGLARACQVVALQDGDSAARELVRAHLRASRLADVIRALELEGLMRLDPVITPATHVYLVGSLALDPGLVQFSAILNLVVQVAGEIDVPITQVGLVDITGGEAPPNPVGIPLYLIEAVTCQGLVLTPEEYQAAVTECLVAVAQPGGSQILAQDRAGFSTLGIAWLNWSPAELQRGLGHYLASKAIERCLDGYPRAPSARPSITEGRIASLLEGLPFLPLPYDGVEAPPDLFGDPRRRKERAAFLQRCSLVLERREEKWLRRMERSAQDRSEWERMALDGALAEALRAGPDGLARAGALLQGTAEGARQRLNASTDLGTEHLRVANALRCLERAEASPGVGRMAVLMGGLCILYLGAWALLGGPWSSLFIGVLCMGLCMGGYTLWRQHRIDGWTQKAWDSLLGSAAEGMGSALRQHTEALDVSLEQRCMALTREMQQATGALRRESLAPSLTRRRAPTEGALRDSLLAEGALESIYQSYLPLVPELASYLAQEGCLVPWHTPDALFAGAQEATAQFLVARLELDPAQLAIRAYGDRLGERLVEAVRRLQDWSRPLLARATTMPEGVRWLLWPEGLPCPPVGSEVQVLPACRSCAAAVTVVHGLKEGVFRRSGRISQNESA